MPHTYDIPLYFYVLLVLPHVGTGAPENALSTGIVLLYVSTHRRGDFRLAWKMNKKLLFLSIIIEDDFHKIKFTIDLNPVVPARASVK
jgi:hypothetical protein